MSTLRNTLARRASLAAMGLLVAGSASVPALAQIAPDQTAAGTNRPLRLAADSPFRDPDIIYLEADELINDEANQILTAKGQVEGRYQDRTLRADRVDYNLETGVVVATGNVALIDATGDIQYADKLELSDELQAGTAANFTARLASGATTTARFVTRKENGEFELFNAFYTACELCEASDRPTWRLRARRVRQDTDARTIRYNDAVLEFFGIPVLYTPYLAHPDPSAERESGILTPTIATSGARGFTLGVPYFWAVDDYTDLTISPFVYSKVNPLIRVEGRRKFATGEINLAGSLAYGTAFNRNGDSLDNPELFVDPNNALEGDELSNHLFLDGFFKPNPIWSYGYTVQLSSDDSYLDRYGQSTAFKSNGLVPDLNRRNTSQAFVAGQSDSFRVSALAVSYEDLNTRFLEDNDTGLIRVVRDRDDLLPVIAPLLNADLYLRDPLIGGRLHLSGNAVSLTRETGSDYARGSAKADYQRTFVLPGGLEAKPFAWGRADTYDIQADTFLVGGEEQPGAELGFSRALGQVGLDLRYPFIRRGRNMDLIVEPRVQFTESFGNPKLDRFLDPNTDVLLLEDGDSPDLDTALLFERNKADGFDFFQTGRRMDAGVGTRARFSLFGRDSEAAVFAGRSFVDGTNRAFTPGSGLAGSQSDYVADIDFNIGRLIDSETRLRYDEDRNTLSRVDSTVRLKTRYVDLSGRYFTLNTEAPVRDIVAGAPPEEISGSIRIKPFKGVALGVSAVRDLDRDVTRIQRYTLDLSDDCTLVQLFYSRRDFNNDSIRNDNTIGIRINLATLGQLGSN